MARPRWFKVTAVATVAVAVVTFELDSARADEESAREYVRLALQHELYGNQELREVLLEAALLESPDYAPAHWHLGHVRVNDQWMDAVKAQRRESQSTSLNEYARRRSEALGDPRQESRLAQWCARNHWDDRAALHFASVALNPRAEERYRNNAVRELELVNSCGTLLSEGELEHLQDTADRFDVAVRRWGTSLQRWRAAVESARSTRDVALAQELAQEFTGLTDPDLIPVLESFLSESGPFFGEHLVALLSGFEQHESTQSLVRFAVLSPWRNVRAAATAELKRRPLHDSIPILLDGLMAPIHSQFLITVGQDGAIRYQHAFLRRHADGNRLATSEHITRPVLGRVLGRQRTLGAAEVVDVQLRARDVVARRALEAALVEHAIQEGNTPVFLHNESIIVALEEITGEQLGRDPADWQAWWQDYNFTRTQKPTYYTFQRTVSGYFQPSLFVQGSCFAAGTPVWTETGIVPIESVKVGDRVLSKHPGTGELAFKVVLRTTAFVPTSETVRILLDQDSVTMTQAHVVWSAGQGWKLAEELSTGDQLHTLHGGVRIRQRDDLPAELEVYNLVVADFNTYFVGESAVLVHDVTFRRPARSLVPGLTRSGLTTEETDLNAPPKSLLRQLLEAFRV